MVEQSRKTKTAPELTPEFKPVPGLCREPVFAWRRILLRSRLETTQATYHSLLMSTAHPGKSGTARLWFCILLLSLVTFLPSGTIGAKVDVAGEQRALTAVIVLPDDGKSAIIDEIDAARYSIRLYLYLLSDEDVIRALLRAHLRGVDVRVMLEPEPYGGAQTGTETWMRLDAAGINVRRSPDEFRFAHVKLAIIDDAVALVMNLNLTRRRAHPESRIRHPLHNGKTVVAGGKRIV
ncbi:MAG: phospholipase D-like domain-containing protein [Thermomicrobiales bacterium]